VIYTPVVDISMQKNEVYLAFKIIIIITVTFGWDFGHFFDSCSLLFIRGVAEDHLLTLVLLPLTPITTGQKVVMFIYAFVVSLRHTQLIDFSI
jgi:hypothetical protein